MVEVGLPHNFAFEFDALYHRQGYLGGFGNALAAVTENERANSWEFPILLKYKLPLPKIKPFVEAGLAPRKISGTLTDISSDLNLATDQYVYSNISAKTKWSGSVGIVAGGGVQLGFGRLRVSPEVRYTYWTSTPIDEFLGNDSGALKSSQNQVDLLVALGWKVH